jgi:hypothetical protein
MKKLTPDQIKDVLSLAERMKQEYPSYRKGQLFFNALHNLFPKVAKKVKTMQYDTFYSDENIEKCITEISA